MMYWPLFTLNLRLEFSCNFFFFSYHLFLLISFSFLFSPLFFFSIFVQLFFQRASIFWGLKRFLVLFLKSKFTGNQRKFIGDQPVFSTSGSIFHGGVFRRGILRAWKRLFYFPNGYQLVLRIRIIPLPSLLIWSKKKIVWI